MILTGWPGHFIFGLGKCLKGEISSVLPKAHDAFFLNQNQLLIHLLTRYSGEGLLFTNCHVSFAGMQVALARAPLTFQSASIPVLRMDSSIFSPQMIVSPTQLLWLLKACVTLLKQSKTYLWSHYALEPAPLYHKCCEVVVLVFHRHHVIADHGIKGLFYRRLLESVMSMNIRIFEYSNKMALKYYSYSHSCHFPSTNIFGYSFVDF